MPTTFADLWRPTGTIDRGPYVLVGLLGFALKHNLDRLVAGYGFHRSWTLFNYWIPVRDVAAAKLCFWERWWRSLCRSSGWA